MTHRRLLAAIIMALTFSTAANSQINNKYSAKNWQLTDLAADSVYGTSVTKAYNEILKNKKPHAVVVAVIDGGLDTAHEDLQGHVWTNTKEIAGNQKDDDGNGYVDDVHGWNFLGGKDGRFIEDESYEIDREYVRLRKKYDNADSSSVSANDKKEFSYFRAIRDKRMKDSISLTADLLDIDTTNALLDSANRIFGGYLKNDSITGAQLAVAAAPDAKSDSLRKLVVAVMTRNQMPMTRPLKSFQAAIRAYVERQGNKLKSSQKDPNAQRADIVGDNPEDISDKNYGNNNIAAGVPSHGTHVAGIIAAGRHNDIGMDGVADSVWIMAVRAIPNGDERDKDVALAIRYAVDNGARIINMSFGKPYSPSKKWVDDAIVYAADHDVLLLHAAGNDALNCDSVKFYPNAVFDNGKKASNVITVGASTGGPDSLLAAPFSNYGKTTVDLFSPGYKVYSTIPGSKYAAFSGTSMATPVAAGIAALLLEYYPALSAAQVKAILERSVVKFPSLEVSAPGSMAAKALFADLSVTGGVVNAYRALQLAATMKGEHRQSSPKKRK